MSPTIGEYADRKITNLLYKGSDGIHCKYCNNVLTATFIIFQPIKYVTKMRKSEFCDEHCLYKWLASIIGGE